MSAKKIFTVIGATGTQGGAIVSHFANKPQYHVRAVTRDPSSKSAVALSKSYPSVELVKASLDDPTSLERAFEGASYVFVVTDFFATMSVDKEVEQGKNAINAALKVLNTGTLERFIFSGLPNVKEVKNPYHNILHVNAKPLIKRYLVEHEQLWKKSTEVAIGIFMEDWKKFQDLFKPLKQEDGSYSIFLPLHATSKLPTASVADDLGPLVEKIITSDKYGGKTVNHVTEEISPVDQLKVWGSVVGVETSFKSLTNEEMNDRLKNKYSYPDFMALNMTEHFACIRDNPDWYHADGSILSTEVLDSWTTWKQFVEKNDWKSYLE
ncbi:NAD(P)-binding protein [Atractiella rhizophila]|nr:NAD(P)-binding protein [Atractiella rhizophila]